MKEVDLRTSAGSRISSALVGAAFLALGICIWRGILDISILVESWSNSSLSVFTVWWSYAGVGVLFLIGSILPSSYKNAKLYEDRLELTKKETKSYGFGNIFNIAVKKRTIQLTFQDGTGQVSFTCPKKSDFPEELLTQYATWKRNNS